VRRRWQVAACPCLVVWSRWSRSNELSLPLLCKQDAPVAGESERDLLQLAFWRRPRSFLVDRKRGGCHPSRIRHPAILCHALSSTVPPSMATRTATRPIFRAGLRSTQANGHSAFIPQCRKVVFEYCDKWPSSAHTRTFLLNHLQSVAKENPHVEFVVKQRNHKEPIARGFYSTYPIPKFRRIPHNSCHYAPSVSAFGAVNNRDKVVPLNGFEVNGIQKKVQLLLDSSGAKIKPLKRRTVETSTESARGIWSGLHVDQLFRI